MFLTEKEIMEQHFALKKTIQYMMERETEIRAFFKEHREKRFVFMGCGSSYMLSKSGQRLFAACKDTAASAVAGGDYLVNPQYYRETVADSIIVTLSRSGRTSEIVRDVKQIKEEYGNPVLSISMKDKNDIMPYSDLDLTIDWSYDESVCQTRTVTNLYAVLLILNSFYNNDTELLDSVKAAIDLNESFKEAYRPVLENIARLEWENVTILCDGAPSGIAEEGALAFTEIAMLPGQCFQLLDYRHGPMVLNNEKTLTIAILQPHEETLQKDMIEDLKGHGGTMVTVTNREGNPYNVAENINVGDIKRFEAWGIPFIYVMQMTAYSKSILLGRNPDQPTGLDAFITLK